MCHTGNDAYRVYNVLALHSGHLTDYTYAFGYANTKSQKKA